MQGSIVQLGTRLALVTATLGLLLFAGAGCGASHNGCIALGQASCAKQSQCSAYLAVVAASDIAYCEQAVADDCEQSTATPDVAYGDASAAGCAQALAALSCDDFFTGNLPAVCRPPGTRAAAAACGDDYQCQSLYCQRQDGQCGVCAPLAQLGQACTGACDVGLQCANSVCQQFRKVGEMCDSNISCLPSLACVKSVCAPPMVGQACGAADECSGLQSQYCSAATLSCTAFSFTVSKMGESCGATATQAYLCGPGLFCKAPTGANFGVCNALPLAGSPCGGADGQGCASPSMCVSGTCKNFDRASCK